MLLPRLLLLLGVWFAGVRAVATCTSGNTFFPNTLGLQTTTFSNPVPYDGTSSYGTSARNCDWNVQANGMLVNVTSLAMNVRCGDLVQVYDGCDQFAPLIGNATCGGSIHAISTGTQVYITFTGLGGTAAVGFNLAVTTIQPNQCIQTASPYSVIFPPNAVGTFSNPADFPTSQMVVDQYCQWNFTAPNGYEIVFNITYDFNDNSCNFPSLYFDNHLTLLPSYNNFMQPPTRTILLVRSSLIMKLYFDCFGPQGDKGFSMTYKVVPKPSATVNPCASANFTNTNGFFSSHTPFTGDTTAMPASQFGTTCMWIITAPAGKFPAVRFANGGVFQIGGYSNLRVHDGPDNSWQPLFDTATAETGMAQYNGWIIGKGQSLTVVFKNAIASQNSDSLLGFQMEYRTDQVYSPAHTHACEYNSAPTPSYSSYYAPANNDLANYQWNLQAPQYHGIQGYLDPFMQCYWEGGSTNDGYLYELTVNYLDLAPGALLVVSDQGNILAAYGNPINAESHRDMTAFAQRPLRITGEDLVVSYYSGVQNSTGFRGTLKKVPRTCHSMCNGGIDMFNGSYGVIEPPCDRARAAPIKCQLLFTVPTGLYVRLNLLNSQDTNKYRLMAWSGASRAGELIVNGTEQDFGYRMGGDYYGYRSGNLYSSPNRGSLDYAWGVSTTNQMYVELEITDRDVWSPSSTSTWSSSTLWNNLAYTQLEYEAITVAHCGNSHLDHLVYGYTGATGLIQDPAPYTGRDHTMPYQYCMWELRRPSDYVVIVVTVEAFSLAGSETLVLEENTYSGMEKSYHIDASSVGKSYQFAEFGACSPVYIRFQSHTNSPGYGFKLRYTYVRPSDLVSCFPAACGAYAHPGAAMVTVPDDGSSVFLGLPCPYKFEDGLLSANQSCRFDIKPATPGLMTYISFVAYDVSMSTTLKILDGSTLALQHTIPGYQPYWIYGYTGVDGTVTVTWDAQAQTVTSGNYGWVMRTWVGPAENCPYPTPGIYSNPLPYNGVTRVRSSCTSQMAWAFGYNVSFGVDAISLAAGETLTITEDRSQFGQPLVQTITNADVGKTFSCQSVMLNIYGPRLRLTSKGTVHGHGYRLNITYTPFNLTCQDGANMPGGINVTASAGLGTSFGYPCPMVGYGNTWPGSQSATWSVRPADASSTVGISLDFFNFRSSDYLEIYTTRQEPNTLTDSRYAYFDRYNPVPDNTYMISPTGYFWLYYRRSSSPAYPFHARAIAVPGMPPQPCQPMAILVAANTTIQAPNPYDGVTQVQSQHECKWFIPHADAGMQMRITLVALTMNAYVRPVLTLERYLDQFTTFILETWDSNTPVGTSATFASFDNMEVHFKPSVTLAGDTGFKIAVTYEMITPVTTCTVPPQNGKIVINGGNPDGAMIAFPCPFDFVTGFSSPVNLTWQISAPNGFYAKFYVHKLQMTGSGNEVFAFDGSDISASALHWDQTSIGYATVVRSSAPGLPLSVRLITTTPSTYLGQGIVLRPYVSPVADTEPFCNYGVIYSSNTFSSIPLDQPLNWQVPYTWTGYDFYAPDQECYFYLDPPETNQERSQRHYTLVRINIHHLNLGKGDSLVIYGAQNVNDRHKIREYTEGTYVNEVVETLSGQAFVYFVANDDFSVGTGFNITFDRIRQPLPPPAPPLSHCDAETIINITEVGQTTRFPQWGVDVTDGTHDCVWKFISPPGTTMDIFLFYNDISGYDTLALYDDDVNPFAYYPSYQYFRSDYTVSSEGNSVYVEYANHRNLLPNCFQRATTRGNEASLFYRMDNRDPRRAFGVYNGWSLAVTITEDAAPANCTTCMPFTDRAYAIAHPARLSGDHGVISSPCGDYNLLEYYYYVGTTCAYLISGPPGTHIELTMANLNGDTPVNLYAGATPSAPLIASITAAGPMVYASNTSQMLVTWADTRTENSGYTSYVPARSVDGGQNFYAMWATIGTPINETMMTTGATTMASTTDSSTTDASSSGTTTATGGASAVTDANAAQAGLSAGAKAGIAVGVIIAIILVVVAIALVMRKKKKTKVGAMTKGEAAAAPASDSKYAYVEAPNSAPATGAPVEAAKTSTEAPLPASLNN